MDNKIRFATIDDKKEIEDLWNNYARQSDVFTSVFFDTYYDNCRTFVVEENGEIIACRSVISGEYMVNGKLLRGSRILPSVSVPTHTLDEEVLLDEILEQLSYQELITFIDPSDKNMFLGFENVYKRKEYIINKANFNVSLTGDVRNKYDTEDLLKCYGSFTNSFNGYKVRSLIDFNNLKDFVYKMGGRIIAYYKNKKIMGYAIYYREGINIIVDEIVYLNLGALVCLINNLFETCDTVVVRVSEKEKLDMINPYLIPQVSDYLMAKINDYNMFSKLYGEEILDTKTGLSINKKPLFLREYL